MILVGAAPTDRSGARITLACAHVIGRRQRNQPAPPHVTFEALTDLDCSGERPWLELLDDEERPRVLRASAPMTVVWSSIWTKRPDAVIEFDLPSDPEAAPTCVGRCSSTTRLQTMLPSVT